MDAIWRFLILFAIGLLVLVASALVHSVLFAVIGQAVLWIALLDLVVSAEPDRAGP